MAKIGFRKTRGLKGLIMRSKTISSMVNESFAALQPSVLRETRRKNGAYDKALIAADRIRTKCKFAYIGQKGGASQ